MCYAFDNLSKKTATTLKEAVSIQQQEYSILRQDACLSQNNFISEWDLQYLSMREQKFEAGVNVCEEYLNDKICIDNFIKQIKELELGDIREVLYKFLPKHLQEIFNS